MAPRTADTSDDEFDLTRLLWGDLPLYPAQPGEAPPPPAPAKPAHSKREDNSPAEDIVLRESPSAWDAAPLREQETAPDPAEAEAANVASDPEDVAGEFDIDLDALADLVDAVGFDEGGPATSAMTDDPDVPQLDERPLTYGELTERLRREVLPRLRTLADDKGYLTLGHLARAVVDLQGSESHLDEVRAFADRASVPVLPSRSHHGPRNMPLSAIEQARQQFGDLLRGQIDEHVVIERFGFVGIPLSEDTRAFLVQAWMCHCLSRAEEQAHAMTVAAEVARAGEDANDWSAEALAAREALIVDNLWLVARMTRHYMGQGIEVDDLLQFGALGLFRAVVKFDLERGDRFVKYANNWVFQSITRHIADHSRLIRIPVHVQERGKAIAEAEARLQQSLEREPTVVEIAHATATSEDIVRASLITTPTVSLDDPSARRTLDSLVDMEAPVEMAEATALSDVIHAALGKLTERERDVLEQRFGLFDGKIRTLEEIGRAQGVTRERIRQIEDKALRRLRHPSRARLLKDYIAPPRPNPALPVPAAAAETLIHEFSTADQEIIRWLWGLDGRLPRSLQSTAKRLRVPARFVRGVIFQVEALHRARIANSRVRPIAIKVDLPGAPAVKLGESSAATRVHLGWMLGAADKTSAHWAARLFGMHCPATPLAVTQLRYRPEDEAYADEVGASAGTPWTEPPHQRRAVEPDAIESRTWQPETRDEQHILDHDPRAVTEAKAGLNGKGDRTTDGPGEREDPNAASPIPAARRSLLGRLRETMKRAGSHGAP